MAQKKPNWSTRAQAAFEKCGIDAMPDPKTVALKLTVAHDPRGDWVLIVRADGKELLKKEIGKQTSANGWLDVSVDLSAYAGKSVKLDLANHPSDWKWEAGYWAKIAIESE